MSRLGSPAALLSGAQITAVTVWLLLGVTPHSVSARLPVDDQFFLLVLPGMIAVLFAAGIVAAIRMQGRQTRTQVAGTCVSGGITAFMIVMYALSYYVDSVY